MTLPSSICLPAYLSVYIIYIIYLSICPSSHLLIDLICQAHYVSVVGLGLSV